MYAHKVIEALSVLDNYYNVMVVEPELKKHVADIKDAVHFSIKFDEAFFNVMQGRVYDYTHVFLDGCRLPYNKITLSVDLNPTYLFIYAENITGEIDNIKETDYFFSIVFHNRFTTNQYKNWHTSFAKIIVHSGTGKLYAVRNPTCNLKESETKKILDDTFNDQGIRIHLNIFNTFLTLLNCKNIGTVDNPPPAKLNNKRIKAGKQPLFTYKTLIIKPTGKKQEAQAAQGLWDNRIHLCRGHFKEYTAEKPLFGRITGRFWWQAAVRGNKDKGVVVKDYVVKTEQ